VKQTMIRYATAHGRYGMDTLDTLGTFAIALALEKSNKQNFFWDDVNFYIRDFHGKNRWRTCPKCPRCP
jgi:hypothetical protein